MNTQFAFERNRVNVSLDDLPSTINGKMVVDSIMDQKYILNHVVSFALPITDEAIEYYKDSYYVLHHDLELMEIFKIEIPSKNDDIVSVIVTPQILSNALIEDHILCEFARDNVYYRMLFNNVFSLIDSILGTANSTGDEPPIYAATTHNRKGGGAILFSDMALNAIYDDLDRQDYIILPSSIHELIITPLGSYDNISDFKAMVQMINESELNPCERLSYNVFKYSKVKGEGHIEKY